ncbi:MAG TPA: hypothetical protein VF657_20880, partial [Actinoplanes sp.]
MPSPARRAEAVRLTTDTFGWRRREPSPGAVNQPPGSRRAEIAGPAASPSTPGRRRTASDTPPHRRAEVAGRTASPSSPGRRRAAPDTPPHRRDAAPDTPPLRRAPGRRRAAEDNPWAVAAEAARRAAVDLTRRALPVAQPTAGTRALSIVVRPEPEGPTVREPAGRRVIGALREWTSADEPATRFTGTHRAPGTLPIEAWLGGRQRQQALLAALVAVGILLIMIPVQQRQSAVDTAAGTRAISTGQKGRASKAPDTTAPTGSGKGRTRPTTAAPA